MSKYRYRRKPEYEVDYGDLSDAYETHEEIPWYNGEDDPNERYDHDERWFGDFE